MRLRRFTVPGAGKRPGTGDEIALDAAQSRHALTVLRLEPGRKIELASPWGLAPAVIAGLLPDLGAPLAPTLVLARLTGPFAGAPEAGLAPGPELALSVVRGPRFDWAVEKAAELGAGRLVPVLTERSVPGAPGSAKRARWARLAGEARKQCGRPGPLIVSEPLPLEAYLNSPGLPPIKFLLDPSGSPLANFLVPRAHDRAGPGPQPPPVPPAAVLVGPEGGLTPGETGLALSRGFQKASLGPLVLRSETAALTALALLGQFAPSRAEPPAD
ncbi:MAG: RNA methyltransferase [Deltaproteobacteria bacterium]|jgi:16S rRNA (uracil1498-N3)-methyltransferase|nr:RNA methyltransferase [Deltaproteobacteria bacterium]